MATIETSPPLERIGNYRFSPLRESDPSESQSVSRYFPVIVVAVVIGTLLIAKWIVMRIEQGDFLAARVFAGFVILSQLSILVVAPLHKNKNKLTASDLPHPADVPPDADQVMVRLSHNDKTVCRSFGWLWFDGDVLRFRGNWFNLDLRPSDFSPKAKLGNLAKTKPAPVMMPKGIARRAIQVMPFEVVNGQRKPSKTSLAELEQKIILWQGAPRTTRPSLLPPLRYGKLQPITKRIWLGTGLASIFSAAVGYLVLVMFSQYLPQSNQWPFILLLAAFPWMYPIMIVVVNLEIKSVEKVIDRLRQSGVVQLV